MHGWLCKIQKSVAKSAHHIIDSKLCITFTCVMFYWEVLNKQTVRLRVISQGDDFTSLLQSLYINLLYSNLCYFGHYLLKILAIWMHFEHFILKKGVYLVNFKHFCAAE